MSRNRNTSRRMPKRPVRLPLIGDPSPVAAPHVVDTQLAAQLLEDESKLEELSDQQQFNTALALGAKATDLIGLDHCYEHYQMLNMGGRPVSGIDWSRDVRWCNNCFQYFRYKKAKR